MRNIFIITLLVSLISLPSWSEPLTIKDLVRRDNLLYKKFSDTPFTGEVQGKQNGKVRKGKRHGVWRWYHDNGQLKTRVTLKNGLRDGVYKGYSDKGNLRVESNYENGKILGTELFTENGILSSKSIYDHKKKIKYNELYDKRKGYLKHKGTRDLISRKKIGFWEYFDENGNTTRTENREEKKILIKEFDQEGNLIEKTIIGIKDDGSLETLESTEYGIKQE